MKIFDRFIKLRFTLLLIPLLSFNSSFADKNELNDSKLSKIIEESLPFKSQYLLGPGDILTITFPGLKIFNNQYLIDPEGNLNLPEIYKINASGLTLDELTRKLNETYQEFIIDPDLNIQVFRYRDISIYISGEVNSPGLYSLKGPNINSENIGEKINDVQQIKISSSPRLFNAIKVANGVTNNADLANIKVIRNNSKSQGGGKIQTTINLLDLILEGDQSQNINLLDGDSVVIPKSKKILKDQVIAINKSNLNPNVITVYITGNVEKTGESKLAKGTTLVQAIASNGGKKLWTGNIEFLRFKSDGSILKNRFRYNVKAPSNSLENPILMNGDIINLQKTLLGKTTEIIREVATPVLSGYGLYSIFN